MNIWRLAALTTQIVKVIYTKTFCILQPGGLFGATSTSQSGTLFGSTPASSSGGFGTSTGFGTGFGTTAQTVSIVCKIWKTFCACKSQQHCINLLTRQVPSVVIKKVRPVLTPDLEAFHAVSDFTANFEFI